MKKNLSILFAFILGLGIIVSSCSKDDDNDLPEFTNVELSADNSAITLTFSEPVYGNDDQTGNLDANDFQVAITGASEVAASFAVDHTAGNATATLTLTITSAVSGDETITIKPADGNSIFDADGEAMLATNEITTSQLAQVLGIIGKWEAYDISLVLLGLGYDDSLKAEFNEDLSYEVKSYIQGIEYVLVGTYLQEKSGEGDIWNITLNQTTMNGAPVELTSQGIFEIYAASPDSMWYEVAQTNPEIAGVTAPTAAAGFGSTSNGAFGTTNIQKYIKK